MKRNTNGITLIALIITIIILLILAMVTINILINQGIIGHANNAVRGYEVSEEKELIALAYQNYKMDKVNNKDAELSVDGATTDWEADENTWYIEFTKTQHNYSLTENGDVATTGERWKKNSDGELVKGDMTLKVGDYVDYDHTHDADGNLLTTSYTSYANSNASADKNNGRSNGYTQDYTFTVGDYEGGWRVLGIKGGKVMLISENPIGSLILSGQQGYSNVTEEMNAIACVYGQGRGAVQARSINVEDINSITGYNPAKTGDGEPYNKGKISEYGNMVTYYWKGDIYPYCEGLNGVTGYIGFSHGRTGFYYYDNGQWKRSPMSATATDTEQGREKIATLKSTYYSYYPTTLTTNSSGDVKGIASSSNEYNILFNSGDYWLASSCQFAHNGGEYDYHQYMIQICYNRRVSGYTIYDSSDRKVGSAYGLSALGVRPIVTLNSDVVITKDVDHDGTSSKPCTIQ